MKTVTKMPNIKELAKAADVSIATASRAISNPQRVSEVTRKKVQKAAQLIGYTPNKIGASLRTSKSGNILAIIPDACDTFNFGVVKSMARAANAYGYSLLLGDTQGMREREIEYGNIAKAKQADGIIMLGPRLPYGDDISADELRNLPPLVNSCEKISTDIEALPYVGIDNELAGYEATQHLVKLGHKNIAAITGELSSPSAKDRLSGYKRALTEAGIKVRDEHIQQGTYNLDQGLQCTEKLLLLQERPSAIFCFSDEIAIGCLHALNAQGFSVPQDMSVIGFDDIPFAHYLNPPLTTIAQPTEDIGKKCVEILVEKIKNKAHKNKAHILPHTFINRKSTAKFMD